MAQQPNVELSPSDLPTPGLEPAPARRQIPRRPGTITTPEAMPEGPGFGTPGPDTGWALRIIAGSTYADAEDRLQKVLAALMSARAAHFGRAPVFEDLGVAVRLAGLTGSPSEEVLARSRRWVDAVSHEVSPGRRAVAEAGPALYR